jgi:hypothetical protein
MSKYWAVLAALTFAGGVTGCEERDKGLKIEKKESAPEEMREGIDDATKDMKDGVNDAKK